MLYVYDKQLDIVKLVPGNYQVATRATGQWICDCNHEMSPQHILFIYHTISLNGHVRWGGGDKLAQLLNDNNNSPLIYETKGTIELPYAATGLPTF